jgi:hypothetical protein
MAALVRASLKEPKSGGPTRHFIQAYGGELEIPSMTPDFIRMRFLTSCKSSQQV